MRNAASFIASQSGPEVGVLHEVLRKAYEILVAWKRRRQVATLADFDDHILEDIGLTRRDVREALQLPFSHDPGRELQFRVTRRLGRGWNV